jgi:hypothetical protein
MNAVKNPELLPTATMSMIAQPARAIHLRQELECEHCKKQEQAVHGLAAMFGIQVEEPKKHKHYVRHGGVTIAYQIDHETRMINIGLAICASTDAYNKKLGFKLATDRIAEKDQVYSFAVSFDEAVRYSVGSMIAAGVLSGFSKSFLATIHYDHLSKEAVDHFIITSAAVRLREIMARADEALQKKHEEWEANRQARKAAKAAAQAQTAKATESTQVEAVQTEPAPAVEATWPAQPFDELHTK